MEIAASPIGGRDVRCYHTCQKAWNCLSAAFHPVSFPSQNVVPSEAVRFGDVPLQPVSSLTGTDSCLIAMLAVISCLEVLLSRQNGLSPLHFPLSMSKGRFRASNRGFFTFVFALVSCFLFSSCLI